MQTLADSPCIHPPALPLRPDPLVPFRISSRQSKPPLVFCFCVCCGLLLLLLTWFALWPQNKVKIVFFLNLGTPYITLKEQRDPIQTYIAHWSAFPHKVFIPKNVGSKCPRSSWVTLVIGVVFPFVRIDIVFGKGWQQPIILCKWMVKAVWHLH